MKIRYKDESVFRSCLWNEWDATLIDVVCWTYKLFVSYGKPFVATCGWRAKRHSNDLHGEVPMRALDARSKVFDQPERIAAEINHNWQYDKARPEMLVCVYHDTGLGLHYHLQVHPNTYLI